MAWTGRKKAALGVVVVLLVAAAAGGAFYWSRRDQGPEVSAETIRTRDLESIVSASGKVQPKRQVSISANTMGRVTRVAVEEGQRVKAGQFLLEIDPRSLDELHAVYGLGARKIELLGTAILETVREFSGSSRI